MRNISQEAIDLFNKDYRQVVRIHFSKGDTAFDITEADIIQGGMTIDRYCVSGSKIEVGSAVAAELTLKLRNYDGKFDAVSFEGATLTVEVGIKKWDALAWEKAQLHWVPCGHFIIDTPPRTLDTISISALDRMVLFDKDVDTSKLHLPASIESLVKQICTQCGVTLQTDVGHLPNSFFSVGSLTTSDGSAITYRQVLRWCAAMTGTCAYIDVDGSLVMGWYEATNFTFDASQRYSSDMLENDIVLTGFTFSYLDKDNKTRAYLAGTKDYTLDLSNCALLTNNQEGVIKRIYEARGGFRYRPYSAIVKSAPYLFPMDIIHYVDKKGVTHDTIVTNVTFTLNCNTAISAVGETITSSSYSTANKGITDQQATANSNSNQQFEKVDSTLDEHQKKVDELFKQADDLYGKADDAFSQIDNLGTNIDGLTKDLTVVKHEITDVNTSIEQTKEEIKLRATKTEAKEYAESAGQDAIATSKTYTDSQIQMTSESIALKVSKDEAVKMVDAAKSDLGNQIRKAETSIEQNADAIKLCATKDDVASLITFTAKDGLVITHKSLGDKKVKISGDGIQVISGSSKISIGNGQVSITEGASGCEIRSDGIVFRGIRNNYELWSNDELTFAEQTIRPNVATLSSYSALMILFRSQKGGTWFAGGGNAGLVSLIVPVSGIEMSMVYPWNTVHKRTVVAYPDRIVFGKGYERTSSYSGLAPLGAWTFNLQNPGGDGWSEDAGMCVPYKIYGFM